MNAQPFGSPQRQQDQSIGKPAEHERQESAFTLGMRAATRRPLR